MNTPVEPQPIEEIGKTGKDRKSRKYLWINLLVGVLCFVGGMLGAHWAWQEADWLCDGNQSRVDGMCLEPKSSDPADYPHLEGKPLAPAPSGPAESIDVLNTVGFGDGVYSFCKPVSVAQGEPAAIICTQMISPAHEANQSGGTVKYHGIEFGQCRVPGDPDPNAVYYGDGLPETIVCTEIG